MPLLGIRQKNGFLGHPQTQGKIERFHQTQQRWLAARPTPRTTIELQHQLDEFREHYNEHRPHRALDITVIDLETGQVLSTHQIEPDKTYWRNQNKEPGRWPSSSK